jgi:hypothetical protein
MPGQEPFALVARDQVCHLRRDEARELRPLPLDRVDETRVRKRDARPRAVRPRGS